MELDGVANKSESDVDATDFEKIRNDDNARASRERVDVASGNVAVMVKAKVRSRTRTERELPLPMEALLTFADAARVLGISLRQLRRLVDGGKIGFVKVSERSPRVRPSELQRFLAASAVKYSED